MVGVVDKERVQCGFGLGVPELDIRDESLIRLNWRWEIENVYVVAFPFLVRLTMFNGVSDGFVIPYAQIRDCRMEFGVEFRGNCNF